MKAHLSRKHYVYAMATDHEYKQVLYFLEFFPWVLLILECANMRIQFVGGNKTRVGAISQHLWARMHTVLLADFA